MEQQIGEYLISDNAYKESVRVALTDIFPEYKLFLRWKSDVAFPEIESFSITAHNKKYIYHDDRVDYEGSPSLYDDDVRYAINEFMTMIDDIFITLQKYKIISNIEVIRDEIMKCAKFNIQNSELLNAICQCKVLLPFYGDNHDKDLYPVFLIDGRYVTYQNLSLQKRDRRNICLLGIAKAIKTRGKYESKLQDYC